MLNFKYLLPCVMLWSPAPGDGPDTYRNMGKTESLIGMHVIMYKQMLKHKSDGNTVVGDLRNNDHRICEASAQPSS